MAIMLDHETATPCVAHFAKTPSVTVLELSLLLPVDDHPPATDTTVTTCRIMSQSERQSLLQETPTTRVPRRTTSLKTLPKQRPNDNNSLHNRYQRHFSSIDGLLQQASAPTQPSKSSSISTITSKQRLQSPLAATEPCTDLTLQPQSRSRHPTHEVSVTSSMRPYPNRVISWTSEETRAKEYSKIDKAHSGCRGLIRALLPRTWCRRGWRDFFDGYCDGDSVRRFRVSIPEKVSHMRVSESSRWDCFT